MSAVPPRSRGSLDTQAQVDRFAERLRLPVQSYIHTEELGAAVLLLGAIAALAWVNSPWSQSYRDLWSSEIIIDLGFFSVQQDLRHWINDGLMTLFFFILGLEIKREIAHGELSSPRYALLPILTALGGIVAPAILYLLFNAGGPGERGWGIPMGTDTAFVLGILALLGRRVPAELRVFLVTATVIDDLGAILVLAVFYTDNIDWGQIAIAGVFLAFIVGAIRLRVQTPSMFLILGVLMWVAVLNSGVHAIITGVILGLLVPANPNLTKESFSEASKRFAEEYEDALSLDDHDRADALLGKLEVIVQSTEAPLERMERLVHPWVSFIVLPFFALANSGIEFSTELLSEALTSPVTVGTFVGLVVGKPLGMWGFPRIAALLRIAQLPQGLNWGQLLGISILGGVGFTFAIFIADRAFMDPNPAKMGVMAASLVAGVSGWLALFISTRQRR